MSPIIVALRTRLIRAPLIRPWGADVPAVHLIAVEVDTDDGVTGHGFSWTPSIGARAVQALLDDDIAAAATGLPGEPSAIWDSLWLRLHELGGGGASTIALAGIDIALWDAVARRARHGLNDELGERPDSVPVYGSGVNLHYSTEELVAQCRRWVDAGYQAVKIKVGKRELAEDVERVSAVRQAIGPERLLRVDANQRWDLDGATKAIRELSAFGLDWVEEPLRADDLEGHRILRSRVDAPIAVGENLYTRYRVEEFLRAGACDVVQPNVVRVGGITPFLRIAELVHAHGLRLAPHLLPDLSGQLALALPTETSVEDVEDAGFATLGLLGSESPVSIRAGRLVRTPASALGLGLRLIDPTKSEEAA